MQNKAKKIRYLFIIYWFLLAYIVAALVWWFIALNNQNKQMANYKIQELQPQQLNYTAALNKIIVAEKRKTAQYIGEGVTFLLLIMAGAVFVFRAVRRQLQFSQQQQNFMMALTHELKTPIAVAKLNLETLQKRKLDEPQQLRLIQTTLQETNRLDSLCNNMLLSSQIEAKGFKISNEEINLTELVKECVYEFKQRFPQRIINTDSKEEIFTIGDKLLLQMAVNNLIDNTLKYSHKEKVIFVLLAQEKNKAVLKVIDEGPGITAEEKKKVFTKYYRTGNLATKAAKGTGLGLYLTQKIAAEHNGNIAVTDNIPSGCIFTLTLPLTI
jgi:signal transduction histidine kinase